MERAQGQADLVLRDGTFYLFVTIDLPAAAWRVSEVLGIDLGIVNLPLTATGKPTAGAGPRPPAPTPAAAKEAASQGHARRPASPEAPPPGRKPGLPGR